VTTLADLPPGAFRKADPSPDPLFYHRPRFVAHIDDRAIAALTRFYRDRLPAGGRVLDLMSSWVSHLPEDVRYAEVVGHGMNAAELARNPRLDRWFTQDLNAAPKLDLPDSAFDAVTVCVSVQYLERPVEVLREVRRILAPGGSVTLSFSNRCFPTKAVAVWQALGDEDHVQLVALYLGEAGFGHVEAHALAPADGRGDPLYAVVGITEAAGGAAPGP